MPTLAQLQAEAAWREETIPPNLASLGARLRAHYGLTADAIGIRGNAAHLRGAHRSRRWIKTSVYCTDRSYTVSRTPGDRSGGDDSWCVGLDVTLPRAGLIKACARLDAAVRAGRLEKITEWYGNKDGDTRVDGYDNISNAVATSDDSHLWHFHLTFDRGRANDDHGDVFAILTGGSMDVSDVDAQYLTPRVEALAQYLDQIRYGPEAGKAVPLVKAVKQIDARLSQLMPVTLTEPQLDALADKVASRLAELRFVAAP